MSTKFIEQEEELTALDPQTTLLLSRIKNMSHPELLDDILRHEKEVRGIDWAQLYADKSLSSLDVKQKANILTKTYLRKLQAELNVADEDLPEYTSQFLNTPYSDSNVQAMPAWGIDQQEADAWKRASGEELRNMTFYRLKVMQSLELTSSVAGYSQLMLTIGVIAWTERAYDIYKNARLANLAKLASVTRAIKAISLQSTKLFVATIVVAVIAEIILYLVDKESVVYMVLLNMTDDDLALENLYLTHGKQNVQFVNPDYAAKHANTLVKKTVLDLRAGDTDACYWIGLFVAQRKDMALYGSQGAFKLAPCHSYPEGACVGWEVTLSNLFGGPNRCLVSAVNEGNAQRFSQETDRSGSLHSESNNGLARVTGKMHSGLGTKGYMSVVFEPAD